jgi:hypothetical protein
MKKRDFFYNIHLNLKKFLQCFRIFKRSLKFIIVLAFFIVEVILVLISSGCRRWKQLFDQVCTFAMHMEF